MPRVKDSSDWLVLRRKPRITGWLGIGWRIAAVIGLTVFLILFHWFERDGLRDNLDGHVSFRDVVYFTMISATTTGYGDIVPVSDHTRLFDALVVTPVRIFFLLIFIGSAYVLRLKLEKRRLNLSTCPPRSTIRERSPVHAGCTLGSISSVSVAPGSP